MKTLLGTSFAVLFAAISIYGYYLGGGNFIRNTDLQNAYIVAVSMGMFGAVIGVMIAKRDDIFK